LTIARVLAEVTEEAQTGCRPANSRHLAYKGVMVALVFKEGR